MRWTELPRLNFFYSQASEVLKNLTIDLLLWLPNHRYSMSSYGPGANLKFPQEKFDIYYVIQNGSYWSMIKDNHRWERGTIHEFDFSEQKISGRHQRATVWYCQQQDCCSSFTSTGSEVGTFLMKCLIPPEGSNSRKEKDLTSESWKWSLKSLIVIILQVTTPAT